MSDNESDNTPTPTPEGSGKDSEGAAERPSQEAHDTPTGARSASADDSGKRAASTESTAGSTTPLTGPTPTESTSTGTRRLMSGSRFWLIPAVTFLVGIALGAGVIAAANSGGDDEAGSGTAATGTTTTSSSTSSPTSDRAAATVTVPGPCLQLADDAQTMLDQVDQVAQAARDLDASRLSDLLRELQNSRDVMRQDSQACQEAGVSVTSSS